MEQVILVDENDLPQGEMEKLEAHQKGLLHRAFSVFVFNSKNELLLQKRAAHKYHSAGLWTNTCCSHPRAGERNLEAANRRLMEEMGLQCELTYLFNFTYHVKFDDGLTEHEFDHVFCGASDELPLINPDEVDSYRYLSLDELKIDIGRHPEHYTAWLKISFDQLVDHLKNRPK